MFKKVIESVEKASVRAALKEGRLVCPDCGAKAGKLPDEWEQVMRCEECGTKAALPDWVAKDGIKQGRADLPPENTKIRREDDGLGGIVWKIPTGGKIGCMLILAVCWLGFALRFTIASIADFVQSAMTGESFTNPTLAIIIFVFNAIALVMLHSGLRQKFLRRSIAVSAGGGVTLREEMFGRGSENTLEPGSVKSVTQKEFYQRNYKPVYGVEIRGKGGKLRFGTGLKEDEKAWLVADITESVFGRAEGKVRTAVASHGEGEAQDVFSFAMPGPRKGTIFGSLVFLIIAITFMGIGIFVLDGDPLPEPNENQAYLPDLISAFFSNSFRAIWLSLNIFFAVLGAYTLVAGLRTLSQDRRIEGTPSDISIRIYKRGLVFEEKSFPRNTISGVRASSSGMSHDKSMKRIELIVGDRSEKISSWIDGDEADELVLVVRTALG